MDLQGSLVDTNLRLYPANNLLNFLKSIPVEDNVPENVLKFVEGKQFEVKEKVIKDDTIPIHLDSKDIENLHKIREVVKVESEGADLPQVDTNSKESEADTNDIPKSPVESEDKSKKAKNDCNEKTKKSEINCNQNQSDKDIDNPHLTTSDIDWLYAHLQKRRNKGEKNVPYLHALLEGAQIETPKNEILKRNPILEARCVKLRAQQEARDYRKMTKSVDNVRMRFPEDSISYQLKQVNRQLIAIGQFIISIFAGFLFGFKGVEWMIGHLDFGFRLLMGVMCALIIALAEIYFLAKKLNEELTIPETVQLGGPTIFADQEKYPQNITKKTVNKEHLE